MSVKRWCDQCRSYVAECGHRVAALARFILDETFGDGPPVQVISEGPPERSLGEILMNPPRLALSGGSAEHAPKPTTCAICGVPWLPHPQGCEHDEHDVIAHLFGRVAELTTIGKKAVIAGGWAAAQRWQDECERLTGINLRHKSENRILRGRVAELEGLICDLADRAVAQQAASPTPVRNAGVLCDNANGPCACGATHPPGGPQS